MVVVMVGRYLSVWFGLCVLCINGDGVWFVSFLFVVVVGL